MPQFHTLEACMIFAGGEDRAAIINRPFKPNKTRRPGGGARIVCPSRAPSGRMTRCHKSGGFTAFHHPANLHAPFGSYCFVILDENCEKKSSSKNFDKHVRIAAYR
ncbi:hypothetical protein BH11VER1_BH11VER1_02380 [soil metagenome]